MDCPVMYFKKIKFDIRFINGSGINKPDRVETKDAMAKPNTGPSQTVIFPATHNPKVEAAVTIKMIAI